MAAITAKRIHNGLRLLTLFIHRIERSPTGGVIVKISIYRPLAERTALIGTDLKCVRLILVKAASGEEVLLQLLITVDGILHQ